MFYWERNERNVHYHRLDQKLKQKVERNTFFFVVYMCFNKHEYIRLTVNLINVTCFFFSYKLHRWTILNFNIFIRKSNKQLSSKTVSIKFYVNNSKTFSFRFLYDDFYHFYIRSTNSKLKIFIFEKIYICLP